MASPRARWRKCRLSLKTHIRSVCSKYGVGSPGELNYCAEESCLSYQSMRAFFILSTEKVMAYPLWSVNLMIELVEGV
jgi:hypothetical protein